MTEINLSRALEVRYSPPAWALFWEVPDATGYAASRHCDALAMGLWPSRGLELHGFEIKASRGDWQRELDDPAKAEALARYCDRWWIVAPDGVVKGDLPPKWGHLLGKSRGQETILKVAVEAQPLEPEPITRKFLAALLRRAHERAQRLARGPQDKANDEAYNRGHADGERQGERQRKELADKLANLESLVHGFESASGIRLADGWNYRGDGIAVGRAVALLRSLSDPTTWARDVRGRIERLLDEVGQFEALLSPPMSASAISNETAKPDTRAAPASEGG